MAQYYYVKIESGGNEGPYSIYYDVVNVNNYAKLTNVDKSNAINLTFEQMKGIWVVVPDNATQIIVINDNVNCNNFSYEFELIDPNNNLGGGELTLNSDGNNEKILTNKTIVLKKNSYNNTTSYIVPKYDYIVEKIEYKNQNNEIVSVPFTKLPNENKYTTGILMTNNGSTTPPKFTVYFGLIKANITKINEVITNCETSTVTINITGGTTHQFSVDSGVTFTNTTTNTTYSTTFDKTKPLNIIVKDDNNNLIKWNEIKCQDIKLTIIPIFTNCGSDGEIQYSTSSFNEKTEFIKQKDETMTFTAVPGTNNTFGGWSNFYESKSLIPFLPFSLNSEYTHTFTEDKTIYSIFYNNKVLCFDFCIYETELNYVLSDKQCSDFCKTCPKKVTLYCDRTDYLDSKGDLRVIEWYSDIELTTKVNYGYYKLNDNKTLPQIFIINNGIATPTCSCDGDNLIC